MLDSPAANSAAETVPVIEFQTIKKSSPSTTTNSDLAASEKDGSNKGGEDASATTTEAPVVDDKLVAKGKDEVIVKSEGDGEGTEEEDEDTNIVYPDGLKFILLTIGLCMANLAVALGTFSPLGIPDR